MTHHEFICGDARQAMQTLLSGSVHCIITSPPYWCLRDYGVNGQVGLESTLEEYVDGLVSVFREARRVLRDDGTLWLNLGDSYIANKTGSLSDAPTNMTGGRITQRVAANRPDKKCDKLKPKDLCGIPWRIAFGLQEDGWYLRSDIIWHKPNPMPESVTDRPTKAHEHVFLLSKSPRYFYDAAAIAEPAAYANSGRESKKRGEFGGKTEALAGREAFRAIRATRNRRDVWTVATVPFDGAHFAVFPPKLVEPMILAGTSSGGCCPECEAPYTREIVRTGHENKRERAHVPGNCTTKTDSTGRAPLTMATDRWVPMCDCDASESVPCTVLDPFGGSGTVSMVAQKLGRNSIYIDLNREYMDMAIKRCELTEKRLFQLATFDVREVSA